MLFDELLSTLQAQKTDRYLRTFLDDPSPTAQLQAIFARCCMAASRIDIDHELLRADIDNYVAALCTHPEPDSLDLDPMLVLDAHKILIANQVRHSGFEQLLDRMASEMRRQPADTLRLGRVRLMAENLRGLGYDVPRSKPSSGAARLLRSHNAWLSSSTPELDDMLDHLLADDEMLREEEARLLSLMALAELRNYRLDIASKITRLLLKRGVQNDMVSEALTYLLLQRRNDGAYGFVTPFDEPTWVRATADLGIYLPLTLNVLWTLHEACQVDVLNLMLVEAVLA